MLYRVMVIEKYGEGEVGWRPSAEFCSRANALACLEELLARGWRPGEVEIWEDNEGLSTTMKAEGLPF